MTKNFTAKSSKVGQEQIHGLLFGDKLSWKAIIYDLINTEQLNPWDIDISLLSSKYLERIRELEGHDFFVSSKVLLAASLLLRIKSEILLNHDLRSLDDILFGRKEEKKYTQERIELDEDVPELIPRTPLPRFRKVTIGELMSSLGKAISTETRRIKRVIVERQHELEREVVLPRRRINVREEMRRVYKKLKSIFSKNQRKVPFSEFAGTEKEEKIAHFIPLLYLDNQNKVWLEQEGHLSEIWVWLKEAYEKENSERLKEMEKEVDEYFEAEEKLEEVNA